MYIYYTRVSKLEGKESNCVRMGIKGIGGGVGGGVGGKRRKGPWRNDQMHRFQEGQERGFC